MEGTTIYNLPDRVSSDWAVSQEEFEKQVQLGLATPDGSIEAVASHAARLRSTVRQLPALTLLLGTFQKTRVAMFPPFPSWHSLRIFSAYVAPSLGSSSKLDVDKQRVQHVLEGLAGKGVDSDYVAGLKVITAIDQIKQDNHEIAFVQSNRGAIVAA